jgi:hypothetical protein
VPIPDLERDATTTDEEDIRSLIGVGGGERGTAALENGTKALMCAVLEGSIREYLGPNVRHRAQAEAWFRTTGHSPFSFPSVCDVLGLEPDAVRKALNSMRARSTSPSVLGRNRYRGNMRRKLRVSNGAR